MTIDFTCKNIILLFKLFFSENRNWTSKSNFQKKKFILFYFHIKILPIIHSYLIRAYSLSLVYSIIFSGFNLFEDEVWNKKNFTPYFWLIISHKIILSELSFLIFYDGYYREYPNQTNQS